MKLALILGSLLAATTAFADTATYKVKGMHCGNCKDAVESSVCKKMEGLASCKVELTDPKNEIGTVTLVTTPGVTINDAKVADLVSAVGKYEATRTGASDKKSAKK